MKEHPPFRTATFKEINGGLVDRYSAAHFIAGMICAKMGVSYVKGIASHIVFELLEDTIKVKTMFIIGNPKDNEEIIKETIKYAQNLPSLYTQFSIFTPYPGTPIFEEYKDLITETKLENFNQYHLTFKHDFLSNEKINELKSLSYYKFYFNFKKIIDISLYFIKSKFYGTKNKRVG